MPGDSDLIVALVALATSVVALFVATTQLFADIFATAEGRRKTSETVMGEFGKLTVKRMRARELRFEVSYVFPHLLLSEFGRYNDSGFPTAYRQLEKDKRLDYERSYPLKSSPDTINEYLKLRDGWHNQGWQKLLSKIRESADVTLERSRGKGEVPVIELQKTLWDLLPDDIGRALASTELFTILVVARRLGAIWQPFRSPSGDELRAEGDGHVFTSTEVRGLGMAMSYHYMGQAHNYIDTKPKLLGKEETPRFVSHVWTREADKFMFGICPGNMDFGLVDVKISDFNDLVLIWNNDGFMDIPWQRIDKKEVSWSDIFKEKEKHSARLRHTTNDIVALTCPMIRPSHKSPDAHMGQVLLPFPDNFENMFQGYNFHGDHEGRKVFYNRLKEQLKDRLESESSQSLVKIRNIAKKLKETIELTLPGRDKQSILADVSEMLDFAQAGYIETTEYFKDIGRRLVAQPRPNTNERYNDESPKEEHLNEKETIFPTESEERKANGIYWHLMRAHLSRSPLVHGEAMENVYQRADREKGVRHTQRRIRCEQVHLLFDAIHHFQTFMKDYGFSDAALVKEAWIVLFFRGMCWSLCHMADEKGTFLPAEYYGSRLPVFLI